MLQIPHGDHSIQEVDGVKYLIVKIDGKMTTKEIVAKLKAGSPVVVPFSQRGHVTCELKAQKVYTHHKTIQAGVWVLFQPCEERKFLH